MCKEVENFSRCYWRCKNMKEVFGFLLKTHFVFEVIIIYDMIWYGSCIMWQINMYYMVFIKKLSSTTLKVSLYYVTSQLVAGKRYLKVVATSLVKVFVFRTWSLNLKLPIYVCVCLHETYINWLFFICIKLC
jgi:hypothetical protein